MGVTSLIFVFVLHMAIPPAAYIEGSLQVKMSITGLVGLS